MGTIRSSQRLWPLPHYGALHGQLRVGRQREKGIDAPRSHQRQLCQQRQLAPSVPGTWSRARTLHLAFTQEKRAGEARCLLVSAGHCCGLGSPHRAGRSAPLALALAADRRSWNLPRECPRLWNVASGKKKNPLIGNPPKNVKEKPKGEPPPALPQLYGKSQGVRQRQESSSWATFTRDWHSLAPRFCF